MALGGRWWLCTLRDYHGLRLGAVESPHARFRICQGYAKVTLVNRNSPRRREALDFLRYEASREYNELIDDQADALGPTIRFAYTPRYLRNPQYPEEDYNAVWRSAMEHAQPDQVTPFVNGDLVARIFKKQLDLVQADEKTPAEAMRDAARLVNVEIRKTIDIDPSLLRRYDALTKNAAATGPGAAARAASNPKLIGTASPAASAPGARP
jgi:hypothetical protein